MSLGFEIAGAQIDGARGYQEDTFLITNLSNADGLACALVIVADGMGGHAAGNVASNMVVQSFNKHVTANYPADNLSEILNEGVLKANHSLAETIKETPALEGMGCTMVAAVLEGPNIYWASVGDSHLYLLRNRELIKINADHSYGGFLDAMEASGTPVGAEPGLSKNMLMSAITGSDIADIDCPKEPLKLKPDDKLIICSDGMDTLSKGKIIKYVDKAETPKNATDVLLQAVEDADIPRQDNTTVVVIYVVDKVTDQPAAVEIEKETERSQQHHAVDAPPPPAAEAEEIELTSTPAGTTEDVPPITIPTLETDNSRKGNKGMLTGIMASVVVAIVAAYFIISTDNGNEPTATFPAEQEDTSDVVTGESETTRPVQETGPFVAEEATAPDTTTDTTEIDAESESAADTTAASSNDSIAGESTVFRDPLQSGSTGPAMIWLPAGSFLMGSPPASPISEERPRHEVTIDRIAISQHEITFSEYREFARATGRRMPDNLGLAMDTHPVISVSWDDARQYTEWLSVQTGETYRLPSEAEWEYAAAGGVTAPFWWGFNEKPGMAHCFGCDSGFNLRKPAAVGSFEPNPYGVHDTAGNVAEWVQDCWHDNYKNAPTDGSVWEGGDCAQRIARGGSYISPMQSTRRTRRDRFEAGNGYEHIGIRVVREP